MGRERVHILFLSDVLYSVHGGAEGIIWKMTRRLPRDRYRCSVATFASRPDDVISNAFDCPVYRFPIRRMYDLRALAAGVRLGRLIRSQRVSIIQTFFPASDLLGGLVARVSGCPVVISSRRDMGFQRTAAHRIGYSLAGLCFDQVQAVCDEVARWHREEDGLPREKVVTVRNGVDLQEMALGGIASLAELGVAGASQVVVCVANIRPVKALEVLVRASAHVCRELPDVRFLVVGQVQDERYQERILELARQLAVEDKIVFCGPRSDVPAILRACQVFYLPSHSEGLSNAMLEAMACGLPCVASDVGGNRELIENGRNGYLVPESAATAGAERIVELLRDRGRAQAMGRSGRARVEQKFSLDAMIDRLTNLYEDLLAKCERRYRYTRWPAAYLAEKE
jgi:glycosyltransferase involved in cell wall biosynthesis